MRLTLCLILLLGGTILGHAATFQLPADKPVVSFEIPDEWNPQADTNGVQGITPDGALYIAIAFVDSKSVGTFLNNALEFLKRNDVEVDNDTAQQQDLKLNGMDVVDVSWQAKDADGPCEVTLDLIGVTENEGLMLLYWAPPKADEKYAEELSRIGNSIQPVEKSAEPKSE